MRFLTIVIIIAAIAAGAILWWQRCPQCFGVIPREPPPPPGPELVYYEHPPATITGLRSINSAGDMVGYYQDNATPGSAHALLIRGGEQITIDPPFAMGDSRAFGILDTGLIALTYALEGRHSTTWDGTTYTEIIYPGGAGTTVRGINNAGDVVGEYVFADSPDLARAFIRVGGVFTAVDFPGATRSSIRGINDAGVSVGYVEYAGTPRRCFIRAADGAITVPDYIGGAMSMCADINNHGDIVGGVSEDGVHLRAFLYRDGELQTFAAPDAHDTLALGLNEAGDIVGEVSYGGNFQTYTVPHKGFFTSSFRRP